jgi:hypothetical protein
MGLSSISLKKCCNHPHRRTGALLFLDSRLSLPGSARLRQTTSRLRCCQLPDCALRAPPRPCAGLRGEAVLFIASPRLRSRRSGGGNDQYISDRRSQKGNLVSWSCGRGESRMSPPLLFSPSRGCLNTLSFTLPSPRLSKNIVPRRLAVWLLEPGFGDLRFCCHDERALIHPSLEGRACPERSRRE